MMQIFEEMKKNVLLIPDSRTDEILGMTTDFIIKYFVICLAISVIVGTVFQMVLTKSALSIPMFALASLVGLVIFAISIVICHCLLNQEGKRNVIDLFKIEVIGSTPSYIFGAIPLVGLVFQLIALANIVLVAAKAYNQSVLKTAAVIIGVAIIMNVVLVLGFTALVFKGYGII